MFTKGVVMKNVAVKSSLLSAAVLFCLSTQAMALPVTGVDTVKLGTGGGIEGQYTVDVIGVGQAIDYFTFCLEKNIYFTPGVTYQVDSVADYATSGGAGSEDGKDFLADETKWFYWKYVTGAFGKSVANVTAMQNIIWFLEGELTSLGDYAAQYTTWLSYAPIVENEKDFSTPGYVVKALNIKTLAGTDAQSQIIGEPVPEPTTMLLFGAGLVGLAGIGRRRRNS